MARHPIMRPNDNSIPPLASTVWEGWSRELLAFLQVAPRDWASIEAWAKQTKTTGNVLRNMLAYLEEKRLISAAELEERVVWFAARVSKNVKIEVSR